MSKKFIDNEEKLDFIISYLCLNGKDIAEKFGLQPSSISRMRIASYNTLKPMHLYAFEKAYKIPYCIFEDKSINTEEKIKSILNKNKDDKAIFFDNQDILDKLEGVWYAYFYSSADTQDVYSIETTIAKDGKVIDENSNFGEVFVGTNQSMIIKQAHNSKNLISITFDNIHIAYGKFPFILTSKTNQLNEVMSNFGFFSREKLDIDSAIYILGDIEHIQLKMQHSLIERICR